MNCIIDVIVYLILGVILLFLAAIAVAGALIVLGVAGFILSLPVLAIMAMFPEKV